MKTFLLDSFNRYKRFSEELDVRTILCNKPWLIFNDCGDKELYIFQEDGSLIASVNGNVTNAKWQYIPANKSLIASFKEQSYMLHPAFFDNTIFALQQDGTDRYVFMIDEQQSKSFHLKSLSELNSYFQRIEHERVEAEQRREEALLAQQKSEQQRIEKERERQRIAREWELEAQAQMAREEQQRLSNIARENHILKQYKIFLIYKIVGIMLIAASVLIVWLPLGLMAFPLFPLPAIASYYIIYKPLRELLKQYLLKKHEQRLEAENQMREKKELEAIKREVNKKRLQAEALKIENKLNNNQSSIELARQISLNVEYAKIALCKHTLKINWTCPNKIYKEVTLIINNGSDVLLYEHLTLWGSKEIELNEVKSTIRITLRLVWNNIPVYKIILINGE